MIWFSCKQCGKKQSRSDSEGGAMVFCDCGNGLRVPFSSTATPDAASFPEAKPMRFPSSAPEPSDAPPAPRAPMPRPPREVPVEDARPSIPLPPADDPLPYRKQERRYRKVDPNHCWHHEDSRSVGRCKACQLPFCKDCLVKLGASEVCGPCKNFRAAQVGQQTRTLPLAIAALVGAIVAGPVAFILSLAGAGVQGSEGSSGGGVLLALLAMLLPAGAMAASLIALWRVEAQARIGGRAMATSGLCVSAIGLLWSLAVLAVIAGRGASG